MGIFSRKDDYRSPFKRNEEVLAAYNLPGVPERTPGVVKLENGFEWRRYVVFFDNGVKLGSLDHSALVRPRHWHRWSQDREGITAKITALLEAEVAQQEELLANLNAAESDTPPAAEAAEADDSPEPSSQNDVETSSESNDADKNRLLEMLPEHLRERSQLARTRLGG